MTLSKLRKEGYQVSKHYRTTNKFYDFIYEMTDGENIIFLSGKFDGEEEQVITASSPAKIGNNGA